MATTVVPLNLFLTWHTKDLPLKMKENVQLLIKQNPEFDVYLFDDSDCASFIKDNFIEDVLDAFNTLIPGAYKADLWRYCILYVYGGIYLDIKYQCVNNFKLIELTDKEYFVTDRPDKSIYNGLMVTMPKNDFLLKSINKIVSNVKNNYYGVCPLCPTGPTVIGSFFPDEFYKTNNLKFVFNIMANSYEFTNEIHMDNKPILSNYPDYRIEQKQFQKTKHYDTLWHKKSIYKIIIKI